MHCNSKFVHWRVRDLASCFHFCHIPLEKEPDISISKLRPQSSKGSKVFDSKGEHKASVKLCTNGKKMCKIKDGGGESDKRSSSQNKAERVTAQGGNRKEATFVEEDYIVFSFKEDGKIHLIDEENSSEECPENDREVSTTATIISIPQANKKDGKKESNEIDSKRPPDETKDIKNHVEQTNTPLNSCHCSESETSSTDSFAFPELGVEWTGSPVHMPRAEKREEEPYPYSYDIRYCYRF